MAKMGELKIALIHDELTRRGGAEIVFEEMIRTWPQADVYALYAGRPQAAIGDKTYKIETSFLQKFPLWFRRHPRRLLPLLPQAAEQFDFSGYDVVVSSASGLAKAIVTRAGVPHICYCHTPTRYLWDNSLEAIAQTPRGLRWLARLVIHYLRLIDYAAAQRVNIFLANSQYTQARIAKYYRRKSEVIYPPVDTAFFTPGKRIELNDYFLCVGRLTRSKKFDQAIRVCEKLGLDLVVVGTGYDHKRLSKLAGQHTTLVGKVSQERLREYYRGARALIQPGVEDFGLASAEALACGTPVIAFGEGGVKEIIRDRSIGILYNDQSNEGVAEALRQFLESDRIFEQGKLQQTAWRFSLTRWRDSIYKRVNNYVESKQV